MNSVSPGFFALLDIPIVRGRVFTEGERGAVLVTESAARRYWPGKEALGQTIVLDGGRRQTVGIVRDAQVVLGIAAAAAAARLLQSVLFGVSPYDPFAFIGAPVVMLAIATVAAVVPTRQAIRVDPVSVLRTE